MRVTSRPAPGKPTKLIVIRGPSGAGKSTVARAVAAATSRETAVVERDHYMLMFNGWGMKATPDQELLEVVILFCLDRGFDVVFEGNFKASTHSGLLGRLFEAHPEENYVFYLDVSLEETLRRHETRTQVISSAKMAELHPAAMPLGRVGETLVPESLSEEEVVRLIISCAGLAP